MKKAVRVATCLAASSAASVAYQPPGETLSAWGLRSVSATSELPSTSRARVHLTVPRGGAKTDEPKNVQEPSSRRKKKNRKNRKKGRSASSKETSSEHHEDDKSQRSPRSQNDVANETKSTSSNNQGEEKEETNSKSSNSRKSDPLLEQIVKEDNFYKILGVPKSASEREILKAYRKRCVKTHPDKTGDRRAFDKVSEAYETLSDGKKRKLYDRFGRAGLEGQEGGPSPFGRAEDVLQSFFFGQSGDSFGFRSSPINRPERYNIEVTLEELYQGLTKTVVVTNRDGSRKKEVEVHIPRGSSEKQGIVLSGEIDFVEGQPPADLLFLIKERPHPVFSRRNHDLAMEMELSLREALCGVDSRKVKMLDGRTIFVSTGESKSPIRTGDVFVLKNEGMPKQDQEGEFGDLYIQFQVNMPTSTGQLSEDEKQQLSSLLGKMEGLKDPKGSSGERPREIVKSSVSDFGRASGSIPTRPEPESFHQDHGPFRSSRSFFYSSGGPNQGQENVECKQM